ncbi:MAG: L-histidine N(alpha)-methyltransferase [Nevskiales bacterium]|nr:L-histidine N(alpha)-methyltransferase [Nevskiales bacterium]
MSGSFGDSAVPAVATGLDAFRSDVLAGLAAPQKTVPPKYFYDARGSELFDRICEQPEYYPTRTERAILDRFAGDMARHIGRDALVIEPGAGSGEKTRVLLGALQAPRAYIPVDISGEYLLGSAATMREHFPGLDVQPVAADFTAPFALPQSVGGLAAERATRRLMFFPGSTLGNFEPDAARRLLQTFRGMAGREGLLLLGVDLQKDVGVLERAYNDAAGMTAAFNLNLLQRINRELGGGFDPARFRHRAHYSVEQQRIEMHLISRCEQTVAVAGRSFRFAEGETLHTENSYKHTPDSVARLAEQAGWSLCARWSDPRDWFALFLFEAV